MLEALIQYQICSALYRELVGVRGSILKSLESRKGDINLLTNQANIEHDLKEMEKVINDYRPLIITAIEQKHKVKFKFLAISEPKPLVKS